MNKLNCSGNLEKKANQGNYTEKKKCRGTLVFFNGSE